MRINKYVAQATGLSRRAADQAIMQGKILVNGASPGSGDDVTDHDRISYQGKPIQLSQTQTVLFNKPAGYVVSRDGQGSDTIYSLLPPELHHLKPVGRLDKYSSGLLLLTNDGNLAQELTHPSHQKIKVYEVTLSQPLAPLHHQMIQDHGIQLEDGLSKFQLERLDDAPGSQTANAPASQAADCRWRVTMRQGRNRQIRRTFLALGYGVSRLHRVQFGPYRLELLPSGATKET